MIGLAAVAAVAAVLLVGVVAYLMVQDAKADAVSDHWRDAHHRRNDDG